MSAGRAGSTDPDPSAARYTSPMNATNPPPRHGRLPTVAVLLVALAAGTGLALWQHGVTPSTTATQPPNELHTTLLYPNPRPIPVFELDRSDGSTLGLDQLRGRWTLLFIGFTHCPDICPTTLSTLASATKRLSSNTPVQVLFVSVDPERDSPQRTGEYAAFFDQSIVAATADHARLEPFTRNLGLVYSVAERKADNYNVDHSASISLISPAAQLVGLIRPPHNAKHIAEDVQAVIDHQGSP